jgi:hypothetical protein
MIEFLFLSLKVRLIAHVVSSGPPPVRRFTSIVGEPPPGPIAGIEPALPARVVFHCNASSLSLSSLFLYYLLLLQDNVYKLPARAP